MLRCSHLLARLAPLCLVSGIPTAVAGQTGRITFEHVTLPNGLDVILAPDSSTQVVAVDVWYAAGSRDEAPGSAGLARLFDRLMFAGTSHIPSGRYGPMVEDIGGRGSADVNEEAARFSESLPSNYLGLGLWLEAERMGSLSITDSGVTQARLGMLDELGQRVNDQPYAAAIADGVAALYDSAACYGYSHPTIGKVASITSLRTAAVDSFYRRFFTPNNARLVVTGDFDPVTARSLIIRYFGSLPRGPDPPAVACTPGFGSGARTRSESIGGNRPSAAGIFYRIPAHDHPDSPALELLGIILSQGAGARLATALARDARMAVATQGGIIDDRRGPGAFGLFAVAAEGVTPDSLAAHLAAQARWAESDSLSEADLERARAIYRATYVTALERPVDIAEQLQHASTFHGNPDAVNTELDRVETVTAADVRRVAHTWLVPNNSLVLLVPVEAAP
ncbi:MAG TPA: pitrilysin family protein [Gemmatimonadales bacterium]|nr:pitrilysin family protein [Gemmatimonadales bacterium]